MLRAAKHTNAFGSFIDTFRPLSATQQVLLQNVCVCVLCWEVKSRQHVRTSTTFGGTILPPNRRNIRILWCGAMFRMLRLTMLFNKFPQAEQRQIHKCISLNIFCCTWHVRLIEEQTECTYCSWTWGWNSPRNAKWCRQLPKAHSCTVSPWCGIKSIKMQRHTCVWCWLVLVCDWRNLSSRIELDRTLIIIWCDKRHHPYCVRLKLFTFAICNSNAHPLDC